MSQHRIKVASSRGSTVHTADPDPKWSLPALGQFTYSETLCGRTIPRHGAWTETHDGVTCTRCASKEA